MRFKPTTLDVVKNGVAPAQITKPAAQSNVYFYHGVFIIKPNYSFYYSISNKPQIVLIAN